MGRISHPSLVSSLSLVSLFSLVSFFLLIYFSSFLIQKKKKRKAERVLQEGLRVFKQKPLKLKRWSPIVGCLSERAQPSSY